MRNRILEIAETPARLRVERRQLVIECSGQNTRIPIEDLAVLIVSHPQVSYTQAVLNELMSHGSAFLTCDERRMPAGLLLPLAGHSTQTERFRRQVQLKQPRRKQLWKQIVAGKIRMQAALLVERLGTDHGLSQLLRCIRSGDASNIEGQAARRYWVALFGSDFRRDREAAGHNAMLNYGYAVLRAATSRAIVAAGLHPTVGLHHHNRYNAFCLADDLMEPYRPLIDRTVAAIVDEHDGVPALSQVIRAQMLKSLTTSVRIGAEQRTVFDALARSASSLVQCIQGDATRLELPEGFADAGG